MEEKETNIIKDEFTGKKGAINRGWRELSFNTPTLTL